jgi:hypothetical protein
MPDQLAPIYDAANKTLLGTILFSAALTPPLAPVVQPTQNELIEYLLSVPSQENPFFDQNVTISILKCDAGAHEASRVEIEAASAEANETVGERFHLLAAEWSKEVQNVSSLTAMTAHPKYRQIIDLGWEVVPFMLTDLQRNKRFWLPALHEITGIQPFDPSDAGNSKRMMSAWIKWGKNKRYIE